MAVLAVLASYVMLTTHSHLAEHSADLLIDLGEARDLEREMMVSFDSKHPPHSKYHSLLSKSLTMERRSTAQPTPNCDDLAGRKAAGLPECQPCPGVGILSALSPSFLFPEPGVEQSGCGAYGIRCLF